MAQEHQQDSFFVLCNSSGNVDRDAGQWTRMETGRMMREQKIIRIERHGARPRNVENNVITSNRVARGEKKQLKSRIWSGRRRHDDQIQYRQYRNRVGMTAGGETYTDVVRNAGKWFVHVVGTGFRDGS